jgi:hypothetical protein
MEMTSDYEVKDLTGSWQMVVQQAAMFACQHGIAHGITEVCLLADDKAKDVTRTVKEGLRGAFNIRPAHFAAEWKVW